ncbi:MAG: hypothetical protein Kow0090_13260 [Myxococcota bacterium]
MTRRQLVNFALSAGLGGVFLWLALKDVDFSGFWKKILNISAPYFILFLILHLIVHWFRVMRIRILLKPLGGIGDYNCFVAGSLGCFGLTVLPFRLGDLVRPAVIKQKESISMTSALACVAIERILDGIVVSLFLFIALFWVAGGIEISSLIINAAYAGFGLFLFGLAFLIFAFKRKDTAAAIVRKGVGIVSKKVAGKLEELTIKFVEGLLVFPERKMLAHYLFETVIYWAVNAMVNVALFYACGLHFEHIIAAGFIVLGVQVLGVMIPAAPAGIGPFEFFTMAALALFLPQDVVNSVGIVYTTISHTMLILIQILFGALFIFAGHIPFIALVERAKKEII